MTLLTNAVVQIAVPTSVGYGAALGGISPLLSALTAGAPGVATVNIDNGFGGQCCCILWVFVCQIPFHPIAETTVGAPGVATVNIDNGFGGERSRVPPDGMPPRLEEMFQMLAALPTVCCGRGVRRNFLQIPQLWSAGGGMCCKPLQSTLAHWCDPLLQRRCWQPALLKPPSENRPIFVAKLCFYQIDHVLAFAAAMLAARILRTASKIAEKVAPSRAITMHAVPNGIPPVPQQQHFQQANGLAASVSGMG